MKKAIYLSAATVMLFAMIFAGGDAGGVQELERNQTHALPAPKSLKAHVQTGFITLNRDMVKDSHADYGDKLVDKRAYALTKRSQEVIMLAIQYPNCL